jgi:hypothetical protein
VTQCYVEYSKAITRRYVAYREVLLDTKFEKLRAMLHSAESRLRAMQVKINSLISARNLNRIRKYFRVFIRALGAIDLWKKMEVENLVRLKIGRTVKVLAKNFISSVAYFLYSFFDGGHFTQTIKLVRTLTTGTSTCICNCSFFCRESRGPGGKFSYIGAAALYGAICPGHQG